MFPILKGADLFCGGGGLSVGAMRAAKTGKFRWDFVAINHWPLAIQTHMKNHPWARHMCASLVPVETQQTKGGIFANGVEAVDPNVAVPGGKLDVLLAAPSCVHH